MMAQPLQAAFAAFSGMPAAALDDWEMVSLVIDGETAGVAAMDGTEIHFALSPEWRGRAVTRARTREFLAPLIARRGYLTTRAINPKPGQREFLERLGFRNTWTQQDGTEHYMLTVLPFDRRN